jgi:magnesium-transporting ATPase (P-type)
MTEHKTTKSPWHQQSAEQVRTALEVPETGLDAQNVKQRLEQYGPNQLDGAKPRPMWLRLAAQFNNALIYVLMAAVAVTAALGHWLDTAVIFAVVLLQGIVGFIQEGRAEQALAAIRHMLAPRALVLRGGKRLHIDASELVPGDILLLEPGDRVAADIRLDQLHALKVDESMLTGESVPVDKSLEPQPVDAALGDRLCMAYSGTLVSAGTARGVVVATG